MKRRVFLGSVASVPLVGFLRVERVAGMAPLDRIRVIAEEMIRELHDGSPYRVCVQDHGDSMQHRLIDIWCDDLESGEDGKYATRGTAVDVGCSEEMVRYRIRAMFLNDCHLQHVGLYSCCHLTVGDIEGESPPAY